MEIKNQECFVSELSRLRESSKDAVVSADTVSDPYMMYMHVDRPVQEAFVSILKRTYDTAHAQLILLCGSVGDGKSHILSYCKKKYPEMMERFYVHNDSTASLYVKEPASYTLQKLMEAFADDQLETSGKKVILAMNLGTLSNFLDADKENRFTRLKAYIEQKGILDEKQEADSGETEESCFHSVNFADYHMYELRASGATSEYMKEILQRIIQPVEQNVFYRSYQKNCKNCDGYARCPVRTNYELLSDEKIQDGIIRVLTESIIKNKILLSTRTLLNLIYELLVNEKYWERGSAKPRKLPEKLGKSRYYESLLPNLLFEKKTSDVLRSMETVDPMRIRNEAVDEFFVLYENAAEITRFYEKDLKEYKYLLDGVRDIDFSDSNMHPMKEFTLRLLIRMLWLLERRKDILPDDETYQEYMSALYAWNTGNHKMLSKCYDTVKNGVLQWNGVCGKKQMQIPSGNSRSRYHLVQDIRIQIVQDGTKKDSEDPLYSFKEELRIKFRIGAEHEKEELDVDFALYRLLKEILQGYEPGIQERRVNVKCTEFVNRMSRGGEKMEDLYICDMSQKEAKEYILSDNGSGYSFEVR